MAVQSIKKKFTWGLLSIIPGILAFVAFWASGKLNFYADGNTLLAFSVVFSGIFGFGFHRNIYFGIRIYRTIEEFKSIALHYICVCALTTVAFLVHGKFELGFHWFVYIIGTIGVLFILSIVDGSENPSASF